MNCFPAAAATRPRPRAIALLSWLLTASLAFSQSGPKIQNSNTAESLRGVSVVSRDVFWASGTHGTYLRTTDAGHTWTPAQVPGTEAVDFRGVAAFSSLEAFLMSSGPGDQSRIYHTSDGGQHWSLQFSEKDPKAFFDSIAFWDRTHGVVLGDPVVDDSGKLAFEVLLTEDGEHWNRVPAAKLPAAMEGEGAFAASNSCLAILPAADRNLWFATGGKAARVFHSPDRGVTWEVVNTPILHGPESAGIFSIAFRDAKHGVIAGGDYKHPDDDGPNLAFTDDGGKTWRLAEIHPQAYFSSAVYDRAVTWPGRKAQKDEGILRLFVVGQDFAFDLRPAVPQRVSPKKDSETKFNAAAALPDGGMLVVGPKGLIAMVP